MIEEKGEYIWGKSCRRTVTLSVNHSYKLSAIYRPCIHDVVVIHNSQSYLWNRLKAIIPYMLLCLDQSLKLYFRKSEILNNQMDLHTFQIHEL